MSKRYYIVDIIERDSGDGIEYTTALAEHAVISEAPFPINPETGAPLRNWTLASVEAIDHARLMGDARIDPLPDFPLDGKVSGINTKAKNAMLAAMQKRGIDTSGVVGTDGYHEVIQLIGDAANTSFNVNSFGV